MKKSLIALAVASAISSPAFAATSNADVYGQISFSVDHIDTNNASGDSSDLVTGRDNASRIGVKGSEDLGGGLSAIWQVELQLNANSDISSTSSSISYYGYTFSFLTGVSGGTTFRNTFVGLKSTSLGTVLLGRHDTPYKLATAKLDPFADTIGDYNAIIGQTDSGGNLFDLRVGGTVAYISPTFNGIHGAIAYVETKNVEPSGADNQKAWSGLVMYDNGPLFGSLAYELHSNLGGASSIDNISAWKVGLGYTFGNTKLGLVYEDISHDANNSNASRNAWYGSVAHTMGNIVLKGAYGKAGDGEGAGNNNTGADFFAVGGDYMFSKRTSVYGVYAKVNQDSFGTYNMFNYSSAGNGRDVDGFSLGIKHTF